MEDKLYLGVSQTDITPKVGANLYGYRPNWKSVSVHDPLTATAFYFTDGHTDALLISLCSGSIQTALCDTLRTKIEAACGVERSHIIVHCTHTHSAPNITGTVGWGDIDWEYYNEICLPAILQAVRGAKENPVAVKMGIAVGESLIGVNRRELDENNVIQLGQNPWGPFDPRMTVISFADESGKAVANIVHYGMHGTCAGINREISRDWSGVMVDALATESGAVTAFFNGAEGDVGPRLSNKDTTGRGDVTYAERHGAWAAQDACCIHQTICAYHDAPLRVICDTVKIPLKERISLEDAKKQYETYRQDNFNIDAQRANYYKRQIELYENGYQAQESRTVAQTILRIGDVAFVSFPYELFSEIALRIAKEKKVPYTLSLSNTNGSEGYFVTQDQLCRGGYEIEMFRTGYHQPYADDADWHLVKETLKNLEKVCDKGE